MTRAGAEREKLAVFEQSYGADRRYSLELALDAYDRHVASDDA